LKLLDQTKQAEVVASLIQSRSTAHCDQVRAWH